MEGLKSKENTSEYPNEITLDEMVEIDRQKTIGFYIMYFFIAFVFASMGMFYYFPMNQIVND